MRKSGSGVVSEQRKKQNREAQRTYRKSLIKRIEDLESRQGLNDSSPPDQSASINTEGTSLPLLAMGSNANDYQRDDVGLALSMNGLTTQSLARPVLHDSPFQYSSFLDAPCNEQAAFPSQESLAAYANSGSNMQPDNLRPGSGNGTVTLPKFPVIETKPAAVDSLASRDATLDKTWGPPACAVAGTALHVAIINDKESIVKLLLERRSDVNARAQQQEDALHLAVKCGQANIVRRILDAGADINSMDECGQTVLCKAIINGDEDMVRLLLDCGANVNQSIAYVIPHRISR